MAAWLPRAPPVTRCDQKRSGWHIVQSGLTSITCTPAFCSQMRLSSFRSTWAFSPRGSMAASASALRASRMASGTSGPTSKQHRPMHGPMAARISSGAQPNSSCMRRTALYAIPCAVPRHPAWTAAMACRTGSKSKTGVQSAAKQTSATPGSSVRMPSQTVVCSRSRPVPQSALPTRSRRSVCSCRVKTVSSGAKPTALPRMR